MKCNLCFYSSIKGIVLLFLTHAQKCNMIIKLVNVSLMRAANSLSVPSPQAYMSYTINGVACVGCGVVWSGEVGGYGGWKEVDQSMKIKAEGRSRL